MDDEEDADDVEVFEEDDKLDEADDDLEVTEEYNNLRLLPLYGKPVVSSFLQ